MDFAKLLEAVVANGLGNVIALFMVYYVVKDNTRREKENRAEYMKMFDEIRSEHLAREDRLGKLIDSNLNTFASNQIENRGFLTRLTDKNDEAHRRQREELGNLIVNQKLCMDEHKEMVEALGLINKTLKSISCAKE